MKAVTFIGDVHVSHVTPSSRKDDYPMIILEKLGKVAEVSPSDAYVFTGDFTHKPQLPLKYIFHVVETLAVNFGNKIYSIIGNHDIPRDKLEKLNETTLGLLFGAGIIKHLNCIKFRVGETPYKIIGLDFGEDIKGSTNPNDGLGSSQKVLVTHSFYEHCGVPTDEALLTNEQINKSGVGHVVLGHDHAKYDIYHNDAGVGIYRPGSLSRGTAHNYNLEREIEVCRMEFYEEYVTAKYVTIPTDPVKVAFKRKTLEEKPKSPKDMVKFIRSMFKMKKGIIDVYNILDNVVIEDKAIRKYTDKLFLNYGFVREKCN